MLIPGRLQRKKFKLVARVPVSQEPLAGETDRRRPTVTVVTVAAAEPTLASLSPGPVPARLKVGPRTLSARNTAVTSHDGPGSAGLPVSFLNFSEARGRAEFECGRGAAR